MNAADLPTGGPTEPVNPDAELEQEAMQHMAKIIEDWALMEQLNGTTPAVAASKMIDVMRQVLEMAMGRGAVRLALLTVYAQTFENAMNFRDRAAAKEQLDQIANARRIVEGEGGLILPGATDAPED